MNKCKVCSKETKEIKIEILSYRPEDHAGGYRGSIPNVWIYTLFITHPDFNYGKRTVVNNMNSEANYIEEAEEQLKKKRDFNQWYRYTGNA